MTHPSSQLTSVIEYFYHWERTTPDAIFLRQPHGEQWQELSFAEAGRQARCVAAALQARGLRAGDHIGLYSRNCAHWVMADLAIMMAGMVSVPFYASLPKDQLEQVIDLADLKALFVGRIESWGDKAEVIGDDLELIRFPHYAGDAQVNMGAEWDQLCQDHAPLTTSFVPALDDLWTIKFTSGTTGTPKGVMHSHRSPALIMANERETNWIGIFELDELRLFSFLPLNHVGERVGVEIPAITLGGSISFAENLERFADNIRDTQPTLFFAVPRIWTKFYLGLTGKMPEKRLDVLLRIPFLSGWIKRKLRSAIGLQDVQVAAAGAAITPAFIKRFFKKLDIHLVEAYGMTEVCGSITNGPDPESPADSVGKAVPFAEIRIDPDSGEILMKSPYMMLGYYKNPEKTAEVFTDGWLHSGDRGEIDEQGFLRVTGRVKDAFKTAKGSYVIPNPLEEVIMQNELVEQVCVAGLGIPQPIVLINLSEAASTLPEQEVAASLLATVQALNETRAKFERISTIVIQRTAWSESNGLLTPTLKVKRAEIDARFGEQFLLWHEAEANVIWQD